jgi:hypothetical protein
MMNPFRKGRKSSAFSSTNEGTITSSTSIV